VPATAFKRNFDQVEREYAQTAYALALVADQSPGKPAEAWWLNFFNTPTAFIPGPERAARERKLGVVFAHFYKIRRGCYTFDAVLATEDASTTAPGELTLAYARYVEECIRKSPDNYLWSHRRWKHAYRPEYADRVLEPLNGIS
jgi:KDO2-lipid IV(A) lauroyltransferase